MQVIDRYIRHAVISSTLVVLGVLLSIEMFMELMRQIPDVGKADYGILQAFFYVPLQLPSDLYQLFPMAGFLGCLIGLGRLAQNSELMVIRSSGVSIKRIAWAVMKSAILMMILVTLIGETLAPRLHELGENYRSEYLTRKIGFQTLGNIWLRNNNEFVNFNHISDAANAKAVSNFQITPKHLLLAASFSPQAHLAKGVWTMQDVAQTQLSFSHIRHTQLAQLPLNILFDALSLKQDKNSIDRQSVMGLYDSIKYRLHAGLNATPYQFSFWQHIIQPFTIIVMIGLGVPFVFGSLRSTTMSFKILIGVLIGFAFYAINAFFGPFAIVYQIPPLLAAAFPTLLFAITAIILLTKHRV